MSFSMSTHLYNSSPFTIGPKAQFPSYRHLDTLSSSEPRIPSAPAKITANALTTPLHLWWNTRLPRAPRVRRIGRRYRRPPNHLARRIHDLNEGHHVAENQRVAPPRRLRRPLRLAVDVRHEVAVALEDELAAVDGAAGVVVDAVVPLVDAVLVDDELAIGGLQAEADVVVEVQEEGV